MENRLHSHYESLSRVIRFTRMADTKAGAVLALQFVLAGVLAARLDGLYPLVAATMDGSEVVAAKLDGAEAVAVILAGAAYILSALAAVGLAVWAYAPATPQTGKSLIYFEDVANMDCQKFIAAAMNADAAEMERQLLDQIYRVSGIASRKMQLVRYAFLSSGASLLTGIPLLVLGSIPF